ncbi:MAG: hypothetical protein ACK4QP_02475 [Pseudorhizobium sp.]
MPQYSPTVFLVLAVALTLPLSLSIFCEPREGCRARPALSMMVASAICPIAASLCFLAHPLPLGLALIATGITLSLMIGNLATRPLTVAVGALSMGIYLHWEWLPA